MSEISGSYNYTGKCPDRATLGIIQGLKYLAKEPEGKVVQSIDLYSDQIFHYSAEADTNDDGRPDTSLLSTSKVKYKGKQALHLRGTPAKKSNSSINPADPNPYIGGLGIAYSKAPATLTKNDLVEIEVFPKTTATLILEIYEDDGGDKHSIDKYPKNFWLPEKDDDFHKIVIKLEPNGKWQKLRIPLKKFVDWNKKTACKTIIPGINENVGNNKFDPKKGAALDFQLTFVSDSWGPEVKDIYIGKEIKFIKMD